MPSNLTDATILVPVDFDEASRRAVAMAVEFAHVFRARIVVLHVVPPTMFPEGTRLLPLDTSDPVDLAEYVSARARGMLDAYFASALVSGVEVRKEVRSGHPVDTILRAMGECAAKLVIVGTHGRDGAARLALGSVAENVLRRSPVPVMVVREPESLAAKREHVRAAITLSGAAAGAAAGAIAGPAGAVAGGAIGTCVGAIAGTVMAREEARADAHDRELDGTIGVTGGSLGAPSNRRAIPGQ